MINVYTEEEAKEKVCPQAVHMLGMQPLINCMGGRCMAWRWKHEDFVDEFAGNKVEYKGKGYCGLGGKP